MSFVMLSYSIYRDQFLDLPIVNGFTVREKLER